jgi:hypothetical protein
MPLEPAAVLMTYKSRDPSRGSLARKPCRGNATRQLLFIGFMPPAALVLVRVLRSKSDEVAARNLEYAGGAAALTPRRHPNRHRNGAFDLWLHPA